MENPVTHDITETALAFRGYNLTNLGRTAELLQCESYRDIVFEELRRFGDICAEYTGQAVSLAEYIESGVEPGLKHYAESLAIVVAVEVAQIRLLHEQHGFDTQRVKVAFGYSLGELVAVSLGGTFACEDMIRVPLSLAASSAELAKNITMGVLFSRGPKIDNSDVEQLCLQVTQEGKGTIGVSAILSPNTYLLIGQNKTVRRFKEVMHDLLPHRAHLRINSNRWPPLHTPIVWQENIADRASVIMETLPGGFDPPCPPVLSLVTGEMSYDDHSARNLLRRWVDHPQRLWDAIDKTLAAGVETIIHVGPEPNVIPSTYRRLSENVRQQTAGASLGSLGRRAVSGLARRPWLASLLPNDATLLRAPHLRHVILEDWLIENAPSG